MSPNLRTGFRRLLGTLACCASFIATGFFGAAFAASHDFNGDARSDILWRNTGTGQALIWPMNGATVLPTSGSPGTVATNWSVAGTGDFDGDGKGDILWHNQATGQVVIWLMSGATIMGAGSPGSAPVAWFAISTGDFNGDGKTDILWVNQFTGQVLIWLLDGTTTPPSVIGGGSLGSAASPWHVRETGDFNGDGMSDILWQNTSTGEVVMWFIDGKTMPPSVIGGGSPGTVTSDWQLQGLNAD